jgi:hypothetical protein
MLPGGWFNNSRLNPSKCHGDPSCTISRMNRANFAVGCLLLSGLSPAAAQNAEPPLPAPASIDFNQAYHHELTPHRHTIPVQDFHSGDDQIGLALIVSPAGVVVSADANGDANTRSYWPKVKEEVLGWKFAPFEVEGKPVTAKVEEYVDLVPPERLPTAHVTPPELRPDSKVSITLRRTVCYGRCPAYAVTVSTSGIVFDGDAFVTAKGKHTDSADPNAVRKLAARFIAADFYSMAPKYVASVTDNPTYILSIAVDGHKKEVVDYVGQREGMPAVIVDLEDAVDQLAQTQRWIKPPQ